MIRPGGYRWLCYRQSLPRVVGPLHRWQRRWPPQALAAAVSYGYQALEQAPLSNAEVEVLLYMREEEKLAHDVCVALYEQWGLPIFRNISRSEQTHKDAVKTLVERYGLPDLTAGRDAGVFMNPELQ
jgi:hypothetical protein